MTEQPEENQSEENQPDKGVPGDVGDDQLPEGLQPTEDNPLARHPGQTGQEDDQIGADREDNPDTAPLTGGAARRGSGGAPPRPPAGSGPDPPRGPRL